uniref:Uncharacterized protein n=1 Tax=Globodera rostochiensis TaxID=31243 RepID=A0A914HDS7_GLORO
MRLPGRFAFLNVQQDVTVMLGFFRELVDRRPGGYCLSSMESSGTLTQQRWPSPTGRLFALGVHFRRPPIGGGVVSERCEKLSAFTGPFGPYNMPSMYSELEWAMATLYSGATAIVLSRALRRNLRQIPPADHSILRTLHWRPSTTVPFLSLPQIPNLPRGLDSHRLLRPTHPPFRGLTQPCPTPWLALHKNK